MHCKAYKKDDIMHISFDGSSLIFSGFDYPVGDAVAGFTSISHKSFEGVFCDFKDLFLDLYYARDSYENIFTALSEYVDELKIDNPYINFYLDTFVMYLMANYDLSSRDSVIKVCDAFLINGAKSLKFYDDTIDPKWHVESGLANFLIDFMSRKAQLKEDINAITSAADELKEFSQLQRLYLLSLQGRNYLTGKFQTSLMPDHLPMPKNIKKLKTALLEKEVDIVEMATIDSIDDMFGYELYHTIKQELPIRKCKYCNNYFIVRGRSDTEYCDRILSGETKPCSIIGATRNYWDGKKDNQVHNEFQKAYKRNHSRRRVGTMSESDFFTWSEEARAKCKECEAGNITLQEYKLWLGNKL